MPGWEQYQWADELGPVAVCVAAVEGVARTDIEQRLACDTTSLHLADFDQAEREQDHAGDTLVVQLDRVDPWLIIVEPNGYLCSIPEVLADLSRGGRALSIFWNVNALMTVGYAEDGTLLRYFDALLLQGQGEPLAEEEGLPFGHPGSPCAAMLMLVDRVTGVQVTPAWLTRSRETLVTARRG